MWVKICGVRTVDQALWAQSCGADAVGVNLVPSSPRCVSPEVAADIADALAIETVLVVMDVSEEVLGELVTTTRANLVQLHGDERPGFGAWLGVHTYKAHRARPGVLTEITEHGGDRFLLDAHVPGQAGGTGRLVDLELAAAASKLGRLVLAGGLHAGNVAQAIERVRPWGVDVASGVESHRGRQDPARVEAFVRAARGADSR